MANVCVAPDLAFATRARRSARVERALAMLPAPPGRTLALVVRQHPHRGAAADAATVRTFAVVAREALRSGHVSAVLVVVQAQGPTAIEDDRPMSAALAAALSDLPVGLLDMDLAPDELAAVYGSCAAVVAVRLHAAILALSQGTPAFAVAYMTRKTEGVMSAAGLPDAWCAFDDATPERIAGALPRLFDPRTRAELESQRSHWQAQLRDAVLPPETPGGSGDARRPVGRPVTGGSQPARPSGAAA
jgi:polysaccharide pyruvyl transferase WcaK-like protein